jgi:hexulose-6-phosphate isomerase
MPRRVLFRIEPHPPAEVDKPIEVALDAGFDGVELALASDTGQIAAGEAVVMPQTSLGRVTCDNGSASVRQHGKAAPIRACAWRCPTCDVSEALHGANALLPDLAQLGTQVLNVTIPPVARCAPETGFPSYADALNFAYQFLRTLRFEAEATGVAIALEAATGYGLLSPVELREIVDTADSWATGACVDVACVSQIGCPRDWITTLGSRIHAVRIPSSHTEPGLPSGSSADGADAPEMARLLDSLDYKRIVIVGDGEPAAAERLIPTLRGAPAREPAPTVPDHS